MIAKEDAPRKEKKPGYLRSKNTMTYPPNTSQNAWWELPSL